MSVEKDKILSFGEKSEEYPFGYGYCQCGCGKKTSALSSSVKVTHHNGQIVFYRTYLKYRAVHRGKITGRDDNKIGVIIEGYEKGYGLCQCGCGEKTKVGRLKNAQNKKILYLRNKYISGHHVKTDEFKKRQSILGTKILSQRDYAWSNRYGKSKTGLYFSKKLGYEIGYMSSYEKLAFEILDDDKEVVRYEPQPFCIQYKYDDGVRTYTPDLCIDYTSGRRVIVEVKPESMKDKTKNQAKFEAIKEFCAERGFGFEIWDEPVLKNKAGRS